MRKPINLKLKRIETAVHHITPEDRSRPNPLVEAKREEAARLKSGELQIKVFGPRRIATQAAPVFKGPHLDR
jgi:hypothetical protein